MKLETERLILRELTEEDIDRIWSYSVDWIFAVCYLENVGCRRLLRKFGMTEAGMTSVENLRFCWRYRDVAIYLKFFLTTSQWRSITCQTENAK